MSERTDFDSPWEEILESYFEEFILFFFPKVHAEINWGKGYEFLDKELQQIMREADVGKRLVDKLAKVCLHSRRQFPRGRASKRVPQAEPRNQGL